MNLENELVSIRGSIAKPSKKRIGSDKLVKIIQIVILAQALLFLSYFIADGFFEGFYLKHYIVIVVTIISLLVVAFMPRQENKELLDKVFTCPECLKNILIKNIDDIKCPHCEAKGLSFSDAMFGCPHCGDPIKILSCPHCEEEIDLDSPYNVRKIKDMRYEEK